MLRTFTKAKSADLLGSVKLGFGMLFQTCTPKAEEKTWCPNSLMLSHDRMFLADEMQEKRKTLDFAIPARNGSPAPQRFLNRMKPFLPASLRYYL
jgi:hypothetical protein